jgi:hypothetical protein
MAMAHRSARFSNAGNQDDMLGSFHNLSMSSGIVFQSAAVTVSWGYNTAGAIVGVIGARWGPSVLPVTWALSSYDTTTYAIPYKHP